MLMTFLESIQMQERFANKFHALITAMSNPVLSGSIPLLSSTLQSLASACTAYSSFSPAVEAISQLQEKILWLSDINYSGVETTLRSFIHAQDHLLNTVVFSSNTACQTLMNSLSMVLEQVEPYLPPEEKEQCESVIKPQITAKPCKRLTLSDALSILSILLSILFFVLGSMPDDQAERIIQQQNKIIANQEAEIVQLRKEDQVLLDTLDSLSDSINLLTDEIELLRDELEDLSDLPDNHSQADPGEPQQDCGNTQD
ncbi:MAG: hypothetical protein HFF26_06160 [Oscillospiraceae bacterium]|nr:hypothetical protein [Oscillospiraceae bacterium]